MADYLEIARQVRAEIEAEEQGCANAVNAINAVSPNLEQGKWALEYLNKVAGARIVKRPDEGGFAIAIWPERRGAELDLALKTLRLDRLAVVDREN